MAVSANHGTAVISVTGNAIRGAAPFRGTGLYFPAKEGTSLRVTSTGNRVEEVHTPRVVDPRVTLSAGL